MSISMSCVLKRIKICLFTVRFKFDETSTQSVFFKLLEHFFKVQYNSTILIIQLFLIIISVGCDRLQTIPSLCLIILTYIFSETSLFGIKLALVFLDFTQIRRKIYITETQAFQDSFWTNRNCLVCILN